MTTDGSEKDLDFEVLKLDYEMAREDERTTTNATATMFGIAVALVAVIGPLLSQTCALSHSKPPNCTEVSPWVVAAAPMAPLALVAYLSLLGTLATIRSYYLRSLEEELHRYTRGRTLQIGVPPLSFIELSVAVSSLRRGQRAYRALTMIMIVAVLFVFGAIAVYIVVRLPPVPRVVSAIVYTIGIVFMVGQVIRATVGGRRLMTSAVGSFRRYRGSLADFGEMSRLKERGLLGYLLLPRPQDVVKWLIFPIAFVLGAAVVYSGNWSGLLDMAAAAWNQVLRANSLSTIITALEAFLRSPLPRALVIFVVLEYLLYEARYQWNDIRGVAEDAAHPVAKDRLPIGFQGEDARRNIVASSIVAVVRVGLAIALGSLVAASRAVIVLAMLIFGLAVLYEWLRSLRPPAGREFTATWSSVLIWVAVGGGYAIRGVTGLVAAGWRPGHPVVLLAAASLLFFGAVFVTLTWVLDACSYCEANPVCGPVDYSRALLDKPHLAALLTFVDAHGRTAIEPGAASGIGARAMPLAQRGRLLTPWNLALLLACGFGGAFGVALVQQSRYEGRPVVLGGIVGLMLAMPLVLANGNLIRFLMIVVVSAGLLGTSWPVLEASSILMVAPWLIFTSWYALFRAQSFVSLNAGLKPLMSAVAGILQRVAAYVVGRQTVELLVRLRRTTRE